MKLEDRVALLEATVAEWESRRRKLIPLELERSENVQAVLRDCLKSYYEKMKDFAGQRKLDDATTEMNRLREQARLKLEAEQKAELAEIIEAIEYFQRYGVSPPGYNIVE